MDERIERIFQEWTRGKNAIQARVSIYHQVRDIPYAVIPELADGRRYLEILRYGRGSCTPKHFLLGDMYKKLGLLVLYAVYPYRWDESTTHYPSRLKKLAEAMPTSHHLACRVDINGQLILVDATLDPPLKALGAPVNEEWDGISDTILPVNPCGEEQLYHPSEARLMPPRQDDERSLAFYRDFNQWLDEARRSQRTQVVE